MNRKICVIGGGPAGLSCALWLKYLGLSPIILEKNDRLGGLQQRNHYQNSWYMGIHGKNGQDFIKEFVRHAEVEALPTLFNATPQAITPVGDDFLVKVGRTEILAKALVICTGQHIRQSAYLNEIEGSDLLKDSAQVCFSPGSTPLRISYVAGQQVAVIGGGDNGLSTTGAMAGIAAHVHLIVRSAVHGFGLYQQRVLDGICAGDITLHQPAQIERFAAAGDQIAITYRDGQGNLETLSVDFIFVRIGFSPNVKAVDQLLQASGIGTLALTDRGYIKTDEFCRTALPRIYAAGDVSNQRDPCVATAVAQGTIAARTLEADLRSLCFSSMPTPGIVEVASRKNC